MLAAKPKKEKRLNQHKQQSVGFYNKPNVGVVPPAKKSGNTTKTGYSGNVSNAYHGNYKVKRDDGFKSSHQKQKQFFHSGFKCKYWCVLRIINTWVLFYI